MSKDLIYITGFCLGFAISDNGEIMKLYKDAIHVKEVLK